INGSGSDSLIEGTWDGRFGHLLANQNAVGQVWAWNPTTGAVLPNFPLQLPDVWGAIPGNQHGGGTQAQIVTGDFNGDGAQDLVVPGGLGVDIYDVKNNV